LGALKPGNSFMEIGAGNLMLSRDLSKHFDKGLVLDFEPSVKRIFSTLPEHIQQKLAVKIGDFFKHTTDELYDCIVACEVMEHIEDDTGFVDKVYKRLNKGGQAIISVPAKDKYWTVHDDVVGHVRRYQKDELIELMGQSGFKQIKVYSYGFPFINMLWLLRAIHGKQQSKQKSGWSKKQQTQKSGVSQIPTKYNFLGTFINKYSFYPLNLISSLFNRLNLSEGYVVVASK